MHFAFASSICRVILGQNKELDIMKAMAIRQFGGPDVFEPKDTPKPQPGPGEVLVRVIAAGTNPVDAKLRANGTWAKLTPPVVLGYDAAGVIEEVGPGVSEFKPGDEVFYTPEIFGNPAGTYAEYNVVSAAIVAPKPKNLSFDEAAAVPLAAGTAWEAVIRRLNLRVGQTILIHGGAGGVGSFAVQIAKAAGARVLATAGPDNQQTLRDLGADVAINYRNRDVAEITLHETGGRGVDAVFDAVGGDLIAKSLRATRPGGHLATVLAPEGELPLLTLRNLTLHGIFLTRERKRLEEMSHLIQRGQLRPVIERVLPLDQVREAHVRLDTGHGRGKIVLHVAENGAHHG
jgi:NADPH:quinone reductase